MAAAEPSTTNVEEPNRRPKPHPLSHRAKAVNLSAVQTINGLIDTLDDLTARCIPPYYSDDDGGSHNKKTTSAGALPELNSRYEIEFILPTSENNFGSGESKKLKRKHRNREALTLRSITIAFPESLRSSVRKWALTSFPKQNDASMMYDREPHPQEEQSYEVAMKLRDHATEEFLRLLTIAGMQVSSPSLNDDDGEHSQRRRGKHQQQQQQDVQWTLSDHFLHELGIDPMDDTITAPPTPSEPRGQSLAFFGRVPNQPSKFVQPTSSKSKAAPPPTYSHPHLQKQRTAFINSIPWNKFANDYDQAYLDAKADWTTQKLKLYNADTAEGRERRERFVSAICGGVRIWRNDVDKRRNGSEEEQGGEDEVTVDEIPEGLDVVAQLVAIRRLSIILYDNFDYLQMERMGRMWEHLVIVLTPPRKRGNQKGNNNHGDGEEDGSRGEEDSFRRRGLRKKLNKWERRLKRRQRMRGVSRDKMRYVADSILGTDNRGHYGNDDGDGTDYEEEEAAEQQHQQQQPSSSLLPESGFKFSYGTHSDQGTGHVTAYIPVDFREGELVRQLYTHVYDYFDNCCGHVGFLRFGADGKVRAAATEEEETVVREEKHQMGMEER